MAKSYKKMNEDCLMVIDNNIDKLIERSWDIKRSLGLYLPEEVRNFTWGVQRMMLLDQSYEDKGVYITIKKKLNEIDNLSEQMQNLLEVRKEIKALL